MVVKERNIKKGGIVHYVRAPSVFYENDKRSLGFPKEFLLTEFEEVLQASFATREMGVIPEYFIRGSRYFPSDLSLVILSKYEAHDKGYPIAELIARDEVLVTGSQNGKPRYSKIRYICKVGVVPEFQHTPYKAGTTVLHIATKEVEPYKPSILRTSSEEQDRWYAEHSDIRGVVPTRNGIFYVHGFGFLDKKTKTELFEGATSDFNRHAIVIVSKPRTTFPLRTLELLRKFNGLNGSAPELENLVGDSTLPKREGIELLLPNTLPK